MQRAKIDISKVIPNEGQIEGLPRNPRFIKDEKFRKLCRSIQNLPEMTEARDILVYPYQGNYIVIGGNMRLRAYQELQWKEVSCCILPEAISIDRLREMVIQDNNPFGETDWNMIANEWDVDELKDWGLELPTAWEITPDNFGDGFSLPDGEKPNSEKLTFTVSNEQADLIKTAIEIAKSNGLECETFGNENSNGNALYQIVKQWVEQKK